jgi:hypothetical protein
MLDGVANGVGINFGSLGRVTVAFSLAMPISLFLVAEMQSLVQRSGSG